ncbi:histone deacetylase HDT2-like isoform X2 [Tasmannia lanceolata]|uniref:histone deacetylase HDT2-like isoform X2 n=1 Tax=Tasmannia lanceolata TaxID=3420 RepID=UPI0040644939
MDSMGFFLFFDLPSIRRVEVKAREPLKCEPRLDKCVHISLASLGEPKKEKENVPIRLYVKLEKGGVSASLVTKPAFRKNLMFSLGSPNPTRSKNNMMINLWNLNLREILKRNSIVMMRMIVRKEALRKMKLRRPSWLHPESRIQVGRTVVTIGRLYPDFTNMLAFLVKCVEVKAREPLKCEPGLDKCVHISLASLGESKKEKENVPIRLYVKVGDQKLVLGTLSSETCAQYSFNLVLEKEFELSHSWENGSVCFFGYKTSIQKESDVFTGLGSPNPTRSKNNMMINLRNLNLREILKRNSIAIMRMIMRKMELRRPSWLHPESRRQDKREWKESSDEEDGATPKKTPVPKEAKLVTLGIQKTGGKNGGHIAPPAKSDNWRPNTTPRKYVYTPCREDFSTFYDFQYHNKKNHDVSQVIKNDVDSGNPRLTAELSKKRPAEPAAKTPLSKEAKLVTPRIQKTDDKKGGHTAAPCPAMQAAKIPVNSDKSKPQTPKSVGQFSCKSCNKDFNSDGALQSHNKADHNDGEC